MATLYCANVGGDDQWLRDQIRGEQIPNTQTKLQYVILEDWMVDSTHAALAKRKQQRGAVFGGSWHQRISYAGQLYDETGVTLKSDTLLRSRSIQLRDPHSGRRP